MSKKEITGKIETYEPTTLDQIFGDTGITKYKTLDLSEYETSLGEMNLSDLQNHALKLGLVPIDNAQMLKKRLVVAFKVHIAKYRKPVVKNNKPIEISPETKKILAEGR